GAADATTSLISASPTSTTVDASSAITVRLRDQFSNDLVAGGDAVTLATDHGSVSSVLDNGDGTYSATLTATTPGTATVTGTVNTAAISDDATVDFAVGAATHLVFTTTDQVLTAGNVSNTITVQRRDQFGNPVTAEPNLAVYLSTTSAGGGFRDDSTALASITQ